MYIFAHQYSSRTETTAIRIEYLSVISSDRSMPEKPGFRGQDPRSSRFDVVAEKAEVSLRAFSYRAVGSKSCGYVVKIGKNRHARTYRKRGEQFFVNGRELALVKNDTASAVGRNQGLPQLRVLEIASDENARSSARRIVTSQAVAFAETRPRRYAVAYAEQFAVFKHYHAVVAVVVDNGAHGAEYRRVGNGGQSHQGEDGFLFSVKFFFHVKPSDNGAVQTYHVAAFCPSERQPECVFGRQAGNTYKHVFIICGKNKFRPFRSGTVYFTESRRRVYDFKQRRSVFCVRERLRCVIYALFL